MRLGLRIWAENGLRVLGVSLPSSNRTVTLFSNQNQLTVPVPVLMWIRTRTDPFTSLPGSKVLLLLLVFYLAFSF